MRLQDVSLENRFVGADLDNIRLLVSAPLGEVNGAETALSELRLGPVPLQHHPFARPSVPSPGLKSKQDTCQHDQSDEPLLITAPD
jgi:hypothetical protein